MNIGKWWRSRMSRNRQSVEARRQRGQLRLESLEDRAVPSSNPTGIFVSGGPTTGVGAGSVNAELAQKDFVDGFLVRMAWKDIEKTDDHYSWDLLDAEIAEAESYGKKVTLGIVNGGGAPDWLYAAGAESFSFLFRGTTPTQIPIPWDSVYLAEWTEFVAELGERYADNSTVVLVHITNSTGNGFEMQLPSTTTDQQNWVAAGYTDQKNIDSWTTVTDAFADAFPDTPLDIELHPVLNGNAVPDAVMNYAWDTYGTRIGAFGSWWSQKNTTTYPVPWELLQEGVTKSFSTVQFVTNATNDPNGFGTGGIQGAIDLALDTGIRYMEIWDTDLKNAAFESMFVALHEKLTNLAPVASDFALTLDENTSTGGPLSASDPDGDPLTFAVVSGPTRGTLALDPLTGIYTYTPFSNASGTDEFTFLVNDGNLDSNIATVRVEVLPANDPPDDDPPPRNDPPNNDPPTDDPVPLGGSFAVGGGTGPSASFLKSDGSTAFTVTPFGPNHPGGVRVATADVTGDGVTDLIAGSGPGRGTTVVVYDGVTGAEVARFVPFESNFLGGVFVAAGDLDGDGKAEIVVSPDEGGGPVVAVFSGASIAAGRAVELTRFLGIQDANFRGGVRVAVGDVTGDGVPDIAVAAGFLGGPRISLWDGRDVIGGRTEAEDRPLANFFAFEDTLRNGTFVAIGDVTGDGHGDLIVGGGPGGGPRVRVADAAALLAGAGVDDAQVANFFTDDPNGRGGVRVASQNLDGDAIADLVVGSGDFEAARVSLYAGVEVRANPVRPHPLIDGLVPLGEIEPSGVFVG